MLGHTVPNLQSNQPTLDRKESRARQVCADARRRLNPSAVRKVTARVERVVIKPDTAGVQLTQPFRLLAISSLVWAGIVSRSDAAQLQADSFTAHIIAKMFHSGDTFYCCNKQSVVIATS